MPTIYAAALRNFEAAASVLTALQSGRLDLLTEARSALLGRPKLVLTGGYNTVTPALGICLPNGTRCDIMAPSSELDTVELRGTDQQWMTIETPLPASPASKCFIECRLASETPLVADVFLRSFAEDGTAQDSGHFEWHIMHDCVSLCRLMLPETPDSKVERRVIIHLRQPASRLVLSSLAITLV
jgi:hypothetical protein